MTGFVLLSLLLVAAAILFVVTPLFTHRGEKADALGTHAVAETRARQLRELEQDLEDGLIDNRDYEKARREIENEANADRRRDTEVVTSRNQGRPIGPVVLALALPLATVGLYLAVGEPDAIERPIATADGMEDLDLDTAIAELEKRLEEHPEDLEGWMMLGRTRVALEDYSGAVEAFSEAVDIAGDDDPRVVADYAEALALEDRDRLTGQAAPLFQRVLDLDPDHPKGLWYSGLVAYETGDHETAIEHWTRLLEQDPPDEFRAALESQLESAREALEGPAEEEETGARLIVSVSVDETLADEVADQDTVFVIARPLDGSDPTPVAGVRIPAAELPTEVRLDDQQAMMEGHQLSNHEEVEVFATVSRTGEATPEPGAPMGRASTTLEEGEETRLELSISDRVE